MTDVVVVESPAKAKTINKYLGGDFTVLASFGHVRDLPPKDGSVRPDEDFAMDWESEDRGERQVNEIARALRGAKRLYLATDPDREGEAISWHVKDMLARRGALKGIDVQRITFNEITKRAIQYAVAHGLEHGGLRHLVEDDALDLDVLQRPLGLQQLQQVPGDRLALAVGVGGEQEPLRPFQRPRDLVDAPLLLLQRLVDDPEVLVGLDRAVALRQVADVAVARQDGVAAAEIFVDGLGLGRRFDDDDVHETGLFRILWPAVAGLPRPDMAAPGAPVNRP